MWKLTFHSSSHFGYTTTTGETQTIEMAAIVKSWWRSAGHAEEDHGLLVQVVEGEVTTREVIRETEKDLAFVHGQEDLRKEAMLDLEQRGIGASFWRI